MATKKRKRANGRSHYSEPTAGDEGNYRWKASFDFTRGYVGINQYAADRLMDRILLSPRQFDAMVAFVQKHRS